MPSKILEYTVAGDASGLERAFARARSATNQLTQNVQRSSREQGSAFHRMRTDATLTERSYHRLHDTARTLIGVTGLAGVAFGLKDVTQEALRAQQQQEILQATVKNAGISWHNHGKAIEDSLNKMSLWSGVAKSDLTNALGNAIRATGSLTGANKLLKDSLDLAAGGHKNFADAQQVVVRAYEGNTRGLKALGINVTAVTTGHDKLKGAIQNVSNEIKLSSGPVKQQLENEKQQLQNLAAQAKAQDVSATRTKALNIIQNKFHGDAQKNAQSTAGRFNQARQAITLAEEEIGSALLPALAGAAKHVGKLATEFRHNWPQIKKDISDVVTPVWNFAKGVGAFVSHHKGVQEVAKYIAEIAVAYKAISKVGELTGLTKLLGLGGRAAGGLANPAGSVFRKLAPVHVWVDNPGFGHGGGGGNPLSTVARDATKVGEGAVAADGADAIVGTASGAGMAAGGAVAAAAIIALGKLGATGYHSATAADIHGFNRGLGITPTTYDPRTGHRNPNVVGTGDYHGTQASGQRVDGALFHVGQGGGPATSFGIKSATTAGVKDATKAVADYSTTVGKVVPISNEAVRKIDAAWSRIQGASHDKFGDISKTVTGAMSDIRGAVGTKSAGARDALGKAFSDAADSVQQRMRDMGHYTQQGLALVQKYTVSALSEFGLSKSQIAGAIRLGAGGPAATQFGGAQGTWAGGYIGAAGEAGNDNVPIMVGRGEAILNRHQQAPVEAALQATYGIGLQDLFQRISRPHYMARGGIAGMVAEANRIDSQHYNYEWGGGHNAAFGPGHGSGHGSGPGVGYDCSGAVSDVLHAGGLLNLPMTSGQFMHWGAPGPGKVTLYASPSHVYMDLAGRYFGTSNSNPGGGAGWFNGGPRPGFVVRHAVGVGGDAIKRVKFPGGMGAMSRVGQGALDIARRAASRVVGRALANVGQVGGGDPGQGGPGGTSSQNQTLGRQMMLASGWGADQWPSLNSLWTRESGWRQNARNPTSGAFGIPQALGHGNVFGSNPRDQIAWGLRYIKGRYGSPAAAWAHEQAFGWYSGGGFAGHPKAHAASLNSSINNITGSGPAPNGPAPKKTAAPKVATPNRVTWGVDPYTHKYVQHTNTEWASIRQRFAAEKKTAAANKKVEGFNPATGRAEFHTAAEWQQIRIRRSVATAKRTAASVAKTGRQNRQQAVGTGIDNRLNTIDAKVTAGQLTQEQADEQKRTIIEMALHGAFGTHLTGAQRLALQGVLAQVGPGKDIFGLDVAAPGYVNPNAKIDDPMQEVSDQLSTVDEHLAAGDYGDPSSPEAISAANAAKHAIVQSALTSSPLSAGEKLQLRAQDYGFTHDQSASSSGGGDLVQAIKGLKDSIDKQNDFAAQVTSVSLGAAWQALADTISGQIVGVGLSGAAATAGDGSLARW